MRAAVFKGAGQALAIEERPDPAPGPGEVLIRVDRKSTRLNSSHRL